MKMSEISIKIEENPRIKQYINENGLSSLNELMKNALEEHLENKSKIEEKQLDNWIRTLNKLVEWANGEKNV